MNSRLWQFIAGYVKIRIEGLKLLQYVNEATARGVVLRSAERQGYSRITAEVTWADYKRLVALAANRPLRVVNVSSGGLPFIARNAVRRFAFTLGLALCVAVLAASNGFILDVRVAGCVTPGLEQRAYAILESRGVKPGAVKSALDLHQCETALMLGLPEISFAAIRVNGVVATANLVEGRRPPEILDKTTPCNVVASMDAVVRKVVVFDGTAKVLPGDAVRSGQVLVDAAQALGTGMRLVHARADVMASVWYEGRGSAPLLEEAKRRTGNTVTQGRLEFAGYQWVIVAATEPPYDQYESDSRAVYLLGPGMKGPKLITTIWVETTGQTREVAFEEARRQAFLDAMNSVEPLLPMNAEIVDSRTVYGYAGGAITATVYIETLQNIAVERKIE